MYYKYTGPHRRRLLLLQGSAGSGIRRHPFLEAFFTNVRERRFVCEPLFSADGGFLLGMKMAQTVTRGNWRRSHTYRTSWRQIVPGKSWKKKSFPSSSDKINNVFFLQPVKGISIMSLSHVLLSYFNLSTYFILFCCLLISRWLLLSLKVAFWIVFVSCAAVE